MAAEKKVKWAPTPVLRIGTHSAFKVLHFVADRIDEEPRRVDMESWISAFKGVGLLWYRPVSKRRMPECGTVACAAGWINIVTRHTGRVARTNGGAQALRILGLPAPGSAGFGGYLPQNELGAVSSELRALFGHTSLRGRQVAKRLRVIADKHATALKAQKVMVA